MRSTPEPREGVAVTGRVELDCPFCGAHLVVSQVQGDRCSCGAEFMRFGPGERETAWDFYRAVTGPRHLLEPAEDEYVVAHL
ncbi:MAG TPA: hypothetical protein VGN26_23475 [Armatimonadota bacterium]|jgi:hypothetical protein